MNDTDIWFWAHTLTLCILAMASLLIILNHRALAKEVRAMRKRENLRAAIPLDPEDRM